MKNKVCSWILIVLIVTCTLFMLSVSDDLELFISSKVVALAIYFAIYILFKHFEKRNWLQGTIFDL